MNLTVSLLTGSRILYINQIMRSIKGTTKKLKLTEADRKHVRRIVAKTKLTEQQVIEKAFSAAQPLLKIIVQTKRARK